jgi:hypothetical protein
MNLQIVPDTWTGLPPPLSPEQDRAMREDAAAISAAFGVSRSLVMDAALAARIQLPRPSCIVTGT